MPAPIQTVNAFSEAELWYMYQQLTEINTNTSGGGGGGLSQTELYEVFNGTNSQGFAISLFNQLNGLSIADQLSETISGGDTPIANILVETISGNNFSLANVCQNTKVNTDTIVTNTNQISNHTGAIRTPVLTSITGNLTIAVQVHNLSVYNSGASAGTINVDGGGAISIPAGVTVNFDAGGNNNRYAINKFVLNATGTTFLVSYTA